MNLLRLVIKAILISIMSSICIVTTAQNRTISGIVTDNQNKAVIGASIKIPNSTSVGTITNIDGKFSLSVTPETKQIEVSFIGMKKKIVHIETGDYFKITLDDDIANLDEVTIIGYQSVRNKDLTGSVATLKGKNIAATPVINIAQALQGKISGVNVIAQDGRPGANVSIRIRGTTSISQSSEPLILIDGIPGQIDDIPSDQIETINVLKDASSTAIYGARGASGVILINTKKAQQGKVSVSYNGYAKFNTPTKYLEALKPYDYLKYVWSYATANSSAYAIPFEKLYGIGDYSGTNSGGIESYKNLKTDDIQKKVYNSSISWNHDLTITGGNNDTKAYFSINYTDDEGLKINSYSKRTNISLKVDQKITNRLNIGFDTRMTDSRLMDDETTTNGTGSVLSSAYRFRPISTSHILGNLETLREGNISQYGKSSMWDTYSPASIISDFEPLSVRQNLRGTTSLNWNFAKHISYHTDFTMNNSWSQKKYWSGATYNNYLDEITGEKLYSGAIDYAKSDSWGIRWSNTLNYEFNTSKNTKLTLLAGHEITDSGGSLIEIEANHFPKNFSKENAFALINQYDKTNGISAFFSGKDIPQRIISYFGRAIYNISERYLFTLTFRSDGSSRFSPQHRWGYFPAGAAAWRISEEPFMQNLNWLNNLKIRLSYGEVGKDNISSSLWQQNWTSQNDYRLQYTLNHQYQPSYDYVYSSMANEDLKWETTITRNFGTDFEFFNGKLSGAIDIYWNTTKDLLMQTTIPGIIGFTTTYANIGQLSNKGIELSINTLIFKNKNLDIRGGINININRNNVDKLASNVTGLYSSQWQGSSTYPINDYILVKGKPIGQVRGLIYDGIYTTKDFTYKDGIYTLKQGIPDLSTGVLSVIHGLTNTTADRPAGQIAYPGLPKFKNLNADNTIDEKDLSVIGNMNPINTGGFNLDIVFKGFDCSAYFNWSYGNKIYNANKLGTLYGGKESRVYENKLAIVKNCYKIYDVQNNQLVRLSTPEQLDAANINSTLPLLNSEIGVVSTLGIEDGSYLRLNTLNIGYTLPKSITDKIKVSNLRIYCSLYNLFVLTKYSGLDPEVNANTSLNSAIYPTVGLDWGTYPRARSFTVGMNIHF